MNEEDRINEIINNSSNEFHNSYNGILLTKSEYELLKKYGFNVDNYTNLSSLIFDIENMLNEEDNIEELETLLMNLSEYNYYHNTNK